MLHGLKYFFEFNQYDETIRIATLPFELVKKKD